MPVERRSIARTQVPGRIRVNVEIDCDLASTSNAQGTIDRFEELVKEWTSKWGFVPDDEILEVLWEKAQTEKS